MKVSFPHSGKDDIAEREKPYEAMIASIVAKKREIESRSEFNQGLKILRQLEDKKNYQTTGVCSIDKSTTNLKNCPFCGKRACENCMTRVRRDPGDPKKFHPICDNCNQAYLDKNLYAPYIKSFEKLRLLKQNREGDILVLRQLLEELGSRISESRKQTTQVVSEENQKQVGKQTEVEEMQAKIEVAKQDSKRLQQEVKKLDDDVLHSEQSMGEKLKLMNEM